MDCNDFIDMVQLGQENSTQCAVHDKTPDSEQKKINIVVRPTYTVGKVISDITTQYRYEAFDLVLQPISKGDLVFLNDCPASLLYSIPGFQPQLKNTLVLLPPGEWDGDIHKRYDLSLTPLKCAASPRKFKPPTPKELKISNSHDSSVNSNNNNNNNSNDSNSNGVATSNNYTHHSDTGVQRHNKRSSDDIITSSPEEASTSARTTAKNSASIKSLPPCSLVTADTPHQHHHYLAASSCLHLSPMSDQDQMSDDDLALGASASPTETEPMNGADPLGLSHKYDGPLEFDSMTDEVLNNITNEDLYVSGPLDNKYPLAALPSATTNSPVHSGYVGLVNQAMTCYLNSLLQALYMTPEFRNALYRWEFDNDNEAKNIPYQLQKLFLNLQISKKSAVETTDLTRSFGWDSTEAWQQHDIQELCRVMFDALEHKFKQTKQANLISNLYEGQMIDYVKCLECNTEKTRSDTFLDIPLPVRPFGSSVAYGSIEEALRAFVQPETLDGNNQYFCEKCNKKCDAHKGLKFKNFPYVLTLHLKRFDFDYQTMHRIKLNDKVTFPQTLNLNTFINATDAQTFANLQAGGSAAGATAAGNMPANGYVLNGVVGATDDCSTTDSGSAMEEDNCSSGIATTASSSQHENDMNDDDEGIDMGIEHRHGGSTANAAQRLKHESGPYLYELFAIMIHSGSASGGHYYAYIKEFDNNEWFCFNDQTVSPITQEDIQRSFGGGSSQAYYSSVYSSSTNAYMLMYRQLDPKRNERSMKESELPEHINTLLPKLHAEDETRISRPSRHSAVSDLALPELIKPRVYFYNPLLKKLKVTRVYVSRTFDIHSVFESAYNMLDVEKFAPRSHCRLVGYDQVSEEILMSFENVSDPELTEIRFFHEPLDFLLEYRGDGQEFEMYKPGGSTWYVHIVDPPSMAVDGPFLVRSMAHEGGDELRRSIHTRLYTKDIPEVHLVVATLPNKRAFVAYDPTSNRDAQKQLQAMAKANFTSLSYFYLNVPNTDRSNLEVMGIPALEAQTPTTPKQKQPQPQEDAGADVVDAVLMNGPNYLPHHALGDSTDNVLSLSGSSISTRRESPLPPPSASSSTTTVGVGHESNSEDSSLSDGDRTLVESIQHRGGGDSQVSSNNSSRSPQLSSPEDTSESNNTHCYVHDGFFNVIESTPPAATHSQNQYFHAIRLEELDSSTLNYRINMESSSSLDETAQKPVTAYKLIVNSHMKLGVFKRRIEALIRVPAHYFKLQRKHIPIDNIDPSDSVVFLNEGETLSIELGKELSKDEQKAKIFYMRLSDLNNDTGRLPCVCEWVFNATTTVAEAKRDLVATLHRVDPDRYQTLSVANCRLWLKGGRNPIKILANEEMLGSEMCSSVTAEFLIQECADGVKPQTSEDSLTVFVRRWHADKLQLDQFQEITLEKDSEIRSTLAKITDLKEEHIAYTKINSSFPCTNISLLNINTSMSWFSIPATMDKYPLTTTNNGNVYFYKDVRPAPRELSPQERRELNAKEKARLDRLGCMSVSLASPRRERALKIYLDSPQTSPNSTPTSAPAAAPLETNSTNASTAEN